MICPYCNMEMSAGFIKVYGEVVAWTPVGERHPSHRWGISPNGVKLGDYSLFNGGEVTAYHCFDCKKTIIQE